MTVGDPVLRRRAREVTAEELRSDDVQRLIDDMIETKRAADGAGIAANQVGETLRIAIVEVEAGNPRYPYKPPVPLTVIVNPVLEPVGERDDGDQRGLPVGPRPARDRRPLRERCACATSTATAASTTRCAAG